MQVGMDIQDKQTTSNSRWNCCRYNADKLELATYFSKDGNGFYDLNKLSKELGLEENYNKGYFGIRYC